MPPKAAAPKAKAASSDHASYQGKLDSPHHNVALQARVYGFDRTALPQLIRAFGFPFEHELTRHRRYDH
jgi:hypothetical protein